MTYPEKLKCAKWQKRRLEMFNKHNWTCQLCGEIDSESENVQLHLHHKSYAPIENDPWNYGDENFLTLCENCHSIIEKIKKRNPYTDINCITGIEWVDNTRETAIVITCDDNGVTCGEFSYTGEQVDNFIFDQKLAKHIPQLMNHFNAMIEQKVIRFKQQIEEEQNLYLANIVNALFRHGNNYDDSLIN